MIDPTDYSLVEIAEMIGAGEVSSLEVTRALLERIERWQPATHSFIRVDPERALAAARSADEALARDGPKGALHGVPLAHKDMFYREGEVSTCGSPARRDWRANTTATVLRRLDAEGAVTLGTLNMATFAYDPTGATNLCAMARNPWRPDRICGGSSSGSGAAVAARLCYGALGSDTGGSVRIPAAICGVVGIKPTAGRVSLYGCLPLSASLDCVGPLARTVRDAARLLAAIAGPDPRDPSTSEVPVADYEAACQDDPRGLRIGIPYEYFWTQVSDEYTHAFDIAIERVGRLGCEVERIHIPEMAPAVAAANILLGTESAAVHRPLFARAPEAYTQSVRTRLENGFSYTAIEYIDALRYRAAALAQFLAAVAEVDILAVPSIGIATPTIDQAETGTPGDITRMASLLSYWTRPANYLGVPAASVPCRFDSQGLPQGIQLIGKPFGEARLLRAASAFEHGSDGSARPAEPAAADLASAGQLG